MTYPNKIPSPDADAAFAALEHESDELALVENHLWKESFS